MIILTNSWGFRGNLVNGGSIHQLSSAVAQRVAACVVQHATSAGLTLHPKVRFHDLATAALGKQTKKHKPLVPEYHHVSHQSKHLPIPSAATVLAPHLGGKSEEEFNAAKDHSLKEQNKLGHFHSPKQFLFSMQYNLQQSQDLIKLERKKNLLQAKIVAKQLEADERKLRASLSVSIQKVLEGKRVLLWKQLLIKYGYDDIDLCDFMFQGVLLVGGHDAPRCYPELLKPATLTEEVLRTSASWRRRSFPVHQRTRSTSTIFLKSPRKTWTLVCLRGLSMMSRRYLPFWVGMIGRPLGDSCLFKGPR